MGPGNNLEVQKCFFTPRGKWLSVHMRLFVAIQLDEQMKDSLAAYQTEMRKNGVSGRYVDKENLHLTLAFIGEYGKPDEVKEALGAVAVPPFVMRLEGVGLFGNLFWAGIEQREELTTLVRRIRRSLSEENIPFDRKRFVPHITLLRQAATRQGENIPMEKAPAGAMRVESFSLMRSDRGKRGMVYTSLADFG